MTTVKKKYSDSTKTSAGRLTDRNAIAHAASAIHSTARSLSGKSYRHHSSASGTTAAIPTADRTRIPDSPSLVSTSRAITPSAKTGVIRRLRRQCSCFPPTGLTVAPWDRTGQFPCVASPSGPGPVAAALRASSTGSPSL